VEDLKDNLTVLDDDTKITYGMLIQAYNEVIKSVLSDALSEISEKASAAGVDIKDVKTSKAFQIALVGGFSNFYLVRKQIEDFIGGLGISQDPRYEGFRSIDRTGMERAIAYGAALVSNEEVQICRTFPYSLGIAPEGLDTKYMAFEFGKEFQHDKPYYILHEGTDDPMLFSVSRIPRLCFSSSGSKTLYQKPIEKYMQTFKCNPDDYFIGFSLDKNECLTLWLKKPESGEEKRPLPDLWTLFGGFVAHERESANV
jgi:molecular chaperone DnaK